MTMRSLLLATTASFAMATGAQAADQLLAGSITSASGGKLEGVTVSAKRDGTTITTSVYTDQDGNYYFPPQPEGKYQVWAQALGFETAKGSVDLTATRKHNISLKPMTDAEAIYRQLPGELMVAALPEDTEDDARIKKIFTNNCTGCHATGYALQFRFDEAGWNKIINMMKVVPGNGTYPTGTPHVNKIMDRNQKELAAYLTRARGPGETSMKFTPRPRPTGDAARAVWTLYDIPINPDTGIGPFSKYNTNDGTDWSLGTTSKIGQLAHDGESDSEGNLYYTSNNPNKHITLAKVDGKTGEVKYFKVNRADGLASNAHGVTRDGEGNLWFDVNTGRRGLGKFDPKTEKITVYQTPSNMSPLGGAVTLDVDGKGFIWASAPDGAVRFDPKNEKFEGFKSLQPYQNPRGSGMTYGAAGDRDGNGWWTQMALDTIGRGDPATGNVTEVRLPAVKTEMDRVKPEDRAFYENFNELAFGTPVPWSQGPRRMGTDKNADVLWVGNSWGASLARIDTKTGEATIVPFPDKTMQPYHIAVDDNHNVWGNLWTSDQIVKFDPKANKWTTFELPVRGTEIRHISLNTIGGKQHVVVPVYRSSQMAKMTVRSEAELAELKAKVQ
jgi:streptogramin lyase